MPTYFRWGVGPFRFSQRLGRTQAQKRAAAKAGQQRARQREFNRTHTETVEYLRTVQGTDSEIGVFGREAGRELSLHLRQGPVPVPGGTRVTISYRGGNLTGIAPAEVPASVATRKAAKADHDARTYRAVITECHIDGVKGGAFTIEADGRPSVGVTVEPDTALRFLSLKNGDIVQVTLGPDDSGLEQFWHMRRANGSKPRSPADFGPGELRSRRNDEDASPEG
jgi:hypothetical protein